MNANSAAMVLYLASTKATDTTEIRLQSDWITSMKVIPKTSFCTQFIARSRLLRNS